MRLKEFQEIPSKIGGLPVFKQIRGLEFNPKTRQQEGEAVIHFGNFARPIMDIAFEKAGELQLT